MASSVFSLAEAVLAGSEIVDGDGAERTADVPDVRGVQRSSAKAGCC